VSNDFPSSVVIITMIVREKPYEIDKNLVGILMDNYRKIQEKKPEGPGRSKEYAACPEPAEG
jgi:hypothetical protein